MHSILTKALYTYHCFSNLVIIRINIYFSEEILNVKFRRDNISGKKYMKVAHKILKSKKKMISNHKRTR